MATDGVHQTVCNVGIEIIDYSDQSPVCARVYDSISISEGTYKGTVVYTMRARDADVNDKLTYKIAYRNVSL